MFLIWTLYTQLFDSQENVQLLNETASGVFSIFQKLTERDVIHFICRMFEPARTGKNENLTLFSLADEKFSGLYDVQILLKDLNEIRKSDQFSEIKTIRDKRLAHSDKERRVSGVKENLHYKSVFFLLEAITNSLNYVRRQVLGRPLLYEYMITIPGSDGTALINKLKKLRKIDDD